MFVRLELCKDNLSTAGRKSKLSLYRPDIATMGSGESGAEWSAGVWSKGMLEYWSVGMLGLVAARLHDSITPLLAAL